MSRGCSASSYDQTACTPSESADGAVDVAGIVHINRAQFHPKRGCHRLNCPELRRASGYPRISKDCHSRYTRVNLFEQLQPFAAEGEFECGEASNVRTGAPQALDKARADGISDNRKHNRNGPSCSA